MSRKKDGISFIIKITLAIGGGLLLISLIIIITWLYLGKLNVYSTEARFASPDVILSAKMDGKIEWLGVREGDVVKSGQIIARLEKKELEQNLSKSQINYQNTEKNLKTMEKLYQEGVISARQLEIAQANYDLAYAQYKIDLTKLENAIVTASISGTVTDKSADQGEVVKVGMPIVKITDINYIYLLSNIAERDINKVKIGQKVYIKVDTYPRKVFLGYVKDIASAAEENKALTINREVSKFKVRIVVDAATEKNFKPGMTANIRIKVK